MDQPSHTTRPLLGLRKFIGPLRAFEALEKFISLTTVKDPSS